LDSMSRAAGPHSGPIRGFPDTDHGGDGVLRDRNRDRGRDREGDG
jgi:hypothetical protein